MINDMRDAYCNQKCFYARRNLGRERGLEKVETVIGRTLDSNLRPPREAIEGTYIDKECPFSGNVSIGGCILAGTCHSSKMMRTIIVCRDYLHFVKKYQRYERRHSNIPAHISPCFRV
ncbi:hypothetical protein CMV_014278 [Castanea mollissima]|uniref:Small ribosomal subunit protein uS17 N-terminal domain-containing protein n=1 Tax=Castanea mollissima TaxID=60419 RepID=A0A8J4VU13_9ROSI|nr:hypothetical protein CMV_014278 [Castanea mollissima]